MGNNIVSEIREKGEGALRPLYKQLKKPFLNYALRYTSDREMRMDAYHEAFIAFFEYCLAGKFDPKKGSEKNLIFLMGRSYLINRLKKESRMNNMENTDQNTAFEFLMQEQIDFEINEKERVIRQMIEKMGEKCKQLIELFYYFNYSIEVIKERLGYKNVNVVSSHKSRCIKQLKEMLQQQ